MMKACAHMCLCVLDWCLTYHGGGLPLSGSENHALLLLHHLLLSVSVRVSGESDAEEKQRRFQESLMSTRSRSLPNYPCLSFSFCLFSSLYNPLCSLIFSFTRRESNRCLPCCGVEVKWRWSCLLVERLVPWEAADSWRGMSEKCCG